MSLKERYYKVSYCGRDSRFRLLMAIDAKIVFDDNALYRHPDVLSLFDPTEEEKVEADAKNLSQNRNISLQYRSPDYPFLY